MESNLPSRQQVLEVVWDITVDENIAAAARLSAAKILLDQMPTEAQGPGIRGFGGKNLVDLIRNLFDTDEATAEILANERSSV